MDANRLPPRVAAALAALADPDAQAPRVRTLAYLAWAGLLSVALHAALITWLATLQLNFGGPIRLALNARLVPAPAAAEPLDPAPQARPTSAPGTAADAPKPAPRPAPAEASATLPDLYFASSEVDIPAQLLEKPPLVYPENPHLWKLHGKVRLRVFIGNNGSVDSVELVSAEPRGHFEEAALAAARQLHYRPAEIRGQPVRNRKLIEVVFDPHEHLRTAGAAPDRRR